MGDVVTMTDNLQKKEDKRCVKSKQAIKHSLLVLLRDKPLATITVSELTTMAQVNRKTFYNHYANISDVLDEMENDLIDKLFGFIDHAHPWHEVTNATNFFGKIFDAIKNNTAEFRLLIQSGTHFNLVEGFRAKIRTVFDDFLSRCDESDRVVMVYLLDYVCAGVVSVLERWSFECRDEELDQLSKVVGAMIDGTVKNLGEVVSWKTDFLKKSNE